MFNDVLVVRLGMLISVKNLTMCLYFASLGSGMLALWWLLWAVGAVLFITQVVWPKMSEEDKAAVTPRAGRVSDKEYS